MVGKSKVEIQSAIFKAAVEGVKKIEDLSATHGQDKLLSFRTPVEGNTIVHIAVRHGHLDVVRLFPKLLQEENNYSNTPLHEAAQWGTKVTVHELIFLLQNSTTSSSSSGSVAPVPDLFKDNRDGDTPFHVALRIGNMAAAKALFSYVKGHPETLKKKNSHMETPLHLYVRYCPDERYREQTLIYDLIEANFSAIIETDRECFNPLIEASQRGRVFILGMLLKYPESIECRDSNGRGILHHLRLRMTDLNARDKEYTLFMCKKILKVPGVDILIISQDQDGNTPLHLAILDKEFDLAQLILERYVEAGAHDDECQKCAHELIKNIKNMEGKTVSDLVTSKPGMPQILKNLMEQVNRGRIMDKQLYQAALDSNKPDGDDSALLCQDVLGKNILHLATENYVETIKTQEHEDDTWSKYERFVYEAINGYPKLMYQKDHNDDTPLHIAARLLDNNAAATLWNLCFKCWYSRSKDHDLWRDLEIPPWKLKNLRGNTPLHDAVCVSNRKCLNIMSKALDPTDLNEALSDVNEYGETAFHMIARYTRNIFLDGIKFSDEFHDNYYLKAFTDNYNTAVYMRDVDGFTPVLRAAHCAQPHVVHVISRCDPLSLYIRDNKGRNVFHHLCTSGFRLEGRHSSVLFDINGEKFGCDRLILSKDDDGNTPLHLAIMDQNFELVVILIEDFVDPKSPGGKLRLTEIKNNKGKSIMDLITCAEAIPLKLKEQIIEPSHLPVMDDKLYEAAVKGDMNVRDHPNFGISEHLKKWFYLARDGSTVLHIALRHHHIEFVCKLVNNALSYELIHLKDSKGDTPLHLAVELPTDKALRFFKSCNERKPNRLPLPGKVKNSKGNTYLHEAARLCRYEVTFSELLSESEDLVYVVNDRDETILHVTARYATYQAKVSLERYFRCIAPLVYMRDCEGFTPVLRAAQYGRLGMVRLLIQKCPQSVNIRDNKGRTILHYMKALVVDLDDLRDALPVWKDIFKQEGVDDLRSAQDEDGNTPLHLAIIEANFDEAKYLMEICLFSENKQELHIESNDRKTIYDLLSAGSRSNKPAVGELKQLLSRINILERQLNYKMDEELYKAAKQGNVEYITVQIRKNSTVPYMSSTWTVDVESEPRTANLADLRSQTADGSNIIHISLKNGNSNDVLEFVNTVLEEYPDLSMRADINGDTPLHLAAKWKNGLPLIKLLIEAAGKYGEILGESRKAYEVPPWAVKNYRGNFPIHEALQSGNLNTALELLRCDEEGASLVNDSGETPLHAFANNGFPVSVDEVDEFVEELMKKGNIATFGAYTQDIEGRTPLMSAAKSGRLLVVKAILKHHPQSAYFRDPKGRTFLHVLRFTGEDVDETSAVETGMTLWENPAADAQRMVQDNDGNTPLHCAIKNGNSTVAHLLTRRCLECETQNLAELRLTNNEGETIPYLIASRGDRDVPSEVIHLMRRKAPKEVRMNRSSYGINKIEMKESANALSVVAALLATITFAAAFQVPGGFGDDGFPILLQKPAFAIFSVANTIAMCSSMLCLFLLLWVMGIGKIQESLKILDASIFLLRLSFYLTLVTFTTGMFVVTIEKSLWLAILVCVLSFLTFLLTQRSILLIISKYSRSAFKGIKTNLKIVKSLCRN